MTTMKHKLSMSLTGFLWLCLVSANTASLSNNSHFVKSNDTNDQLLIAERESVNHIVFKKLNNSGINSNLDIVVFVELAETQNEISRGLMFRNELAPNHGMLFIFNQEQHSAFWMKNVLIPLDIIFISAGLKVMSITKNVQPCVTNPCPLYRSKGPAKYVLEVNAGFAAKHKIATGDKVEITVNRAPPRSDRMNINRP